MIQCETADECIKKIKKSLTDGADAFGIQLCVLKREYRDEETLKRIFQRAVISRYMPQAIGARKAKV